MSKDDDLQVQRRAGANEKAQRVKQRDDDRRHESRLSENVRNLNRHNVYGVFNRHRVENASGSWKGIAQEEPVVCVSWDDAKGYLRWLSVRATQPPRAPPTYRLPSEAEWEYAARAGTTTRRHWGNEASDACGYANVSDLTAQKEAQQAGGFFSTLLRLTSPKEMGGSHSCDDGFTYTAPVGRFKPNGFGLFDMLGNVWEWTEDCHHDSYKEAPSTGVAWVTASCDRRMLRGGGYNDEPRGVRSAVRYGVSMSLHSYTFGFRVARALP
jgi:formylglycine-generating enzyme required for sulfatase activity